MTKRRGPNANFPKIRIQGFGSSHGMEHNGGFQSKLIEAMRMQPKFKEPIFFDFESGMRVIPENEKELKEKGLEVFGLKEKVEKDLKEHDPNPNLIFLIGGTNDLRNGENPTPAEVVQRFREIVECSLNIERCHILICGLIPSCPKYEYHTERSKSRFKECSEGLSNLAKNVYPEKCTFLDVADLFVDDLGNIKKDFFENKNYSKKKLVAYGRDPNYEVKGFHLDSDGAQILVNAIADKIRSIPRRAFSFSTNHNFQKKSKTSET